MNVCHIRRIHIVSSTIRIYLSIIKYPILQMKKFQTNNWIPQMSIIQNTPIVLSVMASLITMNGFRVNKVPRICSFTLF